MLFLAILLTAIEAYLLGSCNSSIIVVKLLKHEDIRNHGSKNAGLTNTLRCFGKVPALLTLIGDLAKGVVATLIAVHLIFPMLCGTNYASATILDSYSVGYIAGICAIMGHIFPIYYGFRGGKGVLVASSILIAIDPVVFCLVIPFFIIVVAITRYVSVGSISAGILYPIITLIMHLCVYGLDTTSCLIHFGLTIITGGILVYMHRTNIERLKNGTENKFGSKKK